MTVKIGVVTGGGDCPGLNAVIRAVTKAAAQRGWIDGPRAHVEALTAIRRAGADMVISYYARPFARAFRG